MKHGVPMELFRIIFAVKGSKSALPSSSEGRSPQRLVKPKFMAYAPVRNVKLASSEGTDPESCVVPKRSADVTVPLFPSKLSRPSSVGMVPSAHRSVDP